MRWYGVDVSRNLETESVKKSEWKICVLCLKKEGAKHVLSFLEAPSKRQEDINLA
jgi:hypothetical protein